MKLSDHVHGIGPTTGGFVKGGWAQAYLAIGDDDRLTLVDTLWDSDAHVILQYLFSIGRTPSEIDHIALTHGHRSHLGGLEQMRQLSDAQVYAHHAEAEIIAGRKPARPVSLLPLRPIPLIPFRVLSYLHIPKHRPCEVTQQLDSSEGQMVGPLEVIPTPGHTDGHVAFFHPSDNVLIVGDAVATWPKFGAGWPGFNHDEEEYQASLKSLLAMGAKVIGTGHGDPISRANTPQMAARLRMLSPRAPVTPPEPTARTGWRRLLARFGGPGSGGG